MRRCWGQGDYAAANISMWFKLAVAIIEAPVSETDGRKRLQVANTFEGKIMH